MPMFEYTCLACGVRFSWLVGVVADSQPPTCPRCGSSSAEKRQVSRFAQVRTDEQAVEALGDLDAAALGDPGDPKTMRRWAKAMGALSGESGGGLGDEFDEYIEEVADSPRAERDAPGEAGL